MNLTRRKKAAIYIAIIIVTLVLVIVMGAILLVFNDTEKTSVALSSSNGIDFSEEMNLNFCKIGIDVPIDQREPEARDDVFGAFFKANQPNELRKVCHGILNTLECAIKVERYWLAKLKFIEHTKNLLNIKLFNHSELQLKDATSQQNFNEAAYLVYNYIPQLKWLVLFIQYYEGNSYQVIDLTTGKSMMLEAEPIFSPDYRRFAICSREGGYSDGVIKIYNTNLENSEESEAEWSLSCAELRWLGNEKMEIEISCDSTHRKNSFCFTNKKWQWCR